MRIALCFSGQIRSFSLVKDNIQKYILNSYENEAKIDVFCHTYYKYCEENSHIEYNKLHGRGFTYTNLLDKNCHEFLDEENIKDNIKNKKYDIIIYSSLHKEKPLLDFVKNIYENNKIVFLCGEDYCDSCVRDNYNKDGHITFVREKVK